MSTTIKISVLLALWAVAFIPVYPELLDTWLNSSNNSHGLLVPLICMYLIYKKKDDLRSATVSTSNIGLILLSLAMAIHIIALIGAVAVISRLMIVMSLIGLLWYVLGDDIFKTLRFPLLMLFFMVPIPETLYSYVSLPLQLFATKVSTFLIMATGIPVYREGNMVYFLQTQLEVAEACSGLRSMMAFIMLAALFAHQMRNPGRFKVAFLLLSSIPLAIGVNIIRVAGTGIIAHGYGDKAARGFLHEFSGLAVFVIGFLLLFCEYLILNRER